ncbi:MAG: hypothetical protein WC404_00180 [Candidatus Omnitrophota bacterium]|jgi:phosphoribosylformylglycinamidine (FGAM) synthase-like enzyme
MAWVLPVAAAIGALTGVASLVMTASSDSGSSSVPEQASAVAVPTAEASLVEAQEDAERRRKIIAATGGQTKTTGIGGAAVSSSDIGKKTLLGA